MKEKLARFYVQINTNTVQTGFYVKNIGLGLGSGRIIPVLDPTWSNKTFRIHNTIKPL